MHLYVPISIDVHVSIMYNKHRLSPNMVSKLIKLAGSKLDVNQHKTCPRDERHRSWGAMGLVSLQTCRKVWV